MNLQSLIAQRLAQKAAADKRAADLAASAQALIDTANADNSRAFTADEETRFNGMLAERKTAQAESVKAATEAADYQRTHDEDAAADQASRQHTPAADRPTGGARTQEPRTYSRESNRRGVSFFGDAYRAQFSYDGQARERLERHSREVQVEGEAKVERGGGQQQERAGTTTTFAGLIVPQYLTQLVALLIRAGRPFANSVFHMPLPEQGMSFIVPRGTTGAAVASQTPENTAVQNTDEVWANLTVAVNTIAGQQDVSRQSLERGTPGIDELVYLDLAGAYHAELGRQALNGSGASNQMLGMFQTAGINAATLFGAAPTYTLFNSKLAGQIAAVAGAGAGIDPQLIVMHPRRWGWLNSLVDTAGRPIIVPTAQGAYNAGGINSNPGAYGDEGTNAGGVVDTNGFRVVGSMQGLPIITDANVPTTVGTESEDLVGVYDPTKIILWEDGDGMPTQLRFEQTLGNQLTVKLVVYGYAAFTAGRYPQGVGKIGGLDTGGATFGLVAPTF